MCKIVARCALCGHEESYELSEQEEQTLFFYEIFGRDLGLLQDLFPDVPAWIRSGAIDQYADGFCVCPRCQE